MSNRKKIRRLSDGRLPFEPKPKTLERRKNAEGLKKEKDRLGGGHLVHIVKSKRTPNFLIKIGSYDFDSAKAFEDAERVAQWLKDEMLVHPLTEDSSVTPSRSEIHAWALPRFELSPEVDAFVYSISSGELGSLLDLDSDTPIDTVATPGSYFDRTDQSGVFTRTTTDAP